ncbi:prion-inhibition and propagation-domain-containing protein [Corynascus similis CBS 632.67]
MDLASTAWSVFTTCYSIYEVVSEAIELNAESQVWNVQMRVERVRFEVWGRTLGFLDEKTGSPKSLDSTDGTINDGGLSDIVQVETANKLICDLLKAISSALNEFRETAEKYNLEKKTPAATPASNSRRERAAAGLSKAWSGTKVFTKHVVYVLTDNGLVEKLIQKLSGLNDSLEKVLTLPQKVQYAKAVSAGVLVKYRLPRELESLLDTLAGNGPTAAQPGILQASARVKQLCLQMDQVEDASPSATGETQPWVELRSFSLPSELVRGYQTPIKHKDEVQWPVSIATYTNGVEPARRVMVEWRSAQPTTVRFAIELSDLERRRDAIAQLLHRTSTMTGAGDYRVLDCLGYINARGRVDDEQDTAVVGFVSLFPEWADEQGEPVTLHSLLRASFDSEKPGTIPSLGTRFRLAQRLANALYQLQCSNWLHRNLSSHQVVFFRDKHGGALRFDEPYLIGFQYSRPDDNKRGMAMNPFSEGFRHNGEFPELYLPAEFSSGVLRRYKRSDDVYSMGVMLMEIAFWEPVNVFHEKGKPVRDTVDKMMEVAATELPSEVGELYAEAVLRCLRGLRQGEVAKMTALGPDGSEQAYDGMYHGEDPEFGLEVDFLWKVLREIEKCRVS